MNHSLDKKASPGQIILTVIIGLFALFCLLPLVLVILVSFTSEESINAFGCSFFPREFSLEGYKYLFAFGKQLAMSYGVTIFITVVGTLFGLLIMSMFAYAMSRRNFRLTGFLSVFIVIPMLFSGGQLATYMIYTNVYHLKDTLAVLILPMCVVPMNVIILRTFIRTNVPDSLCEAAMIDGANEFTVFFRIVLPLIKPVLAAVGFMMATAYWNDWQNALLYISSASRTPLQLLLVRIQKNLDFLLQANKLAGGALSQIRLDVPKTSATMAVVVAVIGPIIIAYPFFQKYLVKGLTIGSVKE